jgi:endo-1,4-beta-D-glucanase Y
VNIATGKTTGNGPVGFSASMLPFLQNDEARAVSASASPITIPARMPTTARS